ncbi:hypothetical protein CW746_07830 [Staphylococcus succinus]|uniref:VraH family protein n=2 Tax=Staphylococcus TaxID=1279 RepID=A0ABX5IN24_9STAP|nr:hypothetical protein CW746_07830 [Staphylococcus succinus]PNZ23445.1 hypothetical protein CD109_02230 [Staphylococcus succinus subsp. succinus]PTI69050.1 hypothetical protein BU057_06555 [Staphylococcus succinus]PTJ82346.1 hypothetical protein BU055_09560 [Staphylococcus succinus]RIN27629.1 hypothetical protein BU067_01830 [Staphylococcus succinus]
MLLMKIRDYISQVKENVLNMEVKSKSFVIMIVSIIILSIVFTPFIGVPAGFIIGSYSYSKH